MRIKIQAIPAFKDNYIWLITHPTKPVSLVVDPGDAKPVLEALHLQQLSLSGILITHKHNDHIGGLKELLEKFDIPVFGNKIENVPLVNHHVSEKEKIYLKDWPPIEVIEVPGHTLGHISYLIDSSLFCGDTLFGAGCGRIFEGTPSQMYESLGKLKALPKDTLVYCAHEYTLKNLSFAFMLEPENPDIKSRIRTVEDLISKGLASVPFTLKTEEETNPFFRCDNPNIQKTIQRQFGKKIENEPEVFKYLREWRNQW